MIHIYLYNEPTAHTLDLGTLVTYLRQLVPEHYVESREEFLHYYLSHQPQESEATIMHLARGMARAKVRRPDRLELNPQPLLGEIEYERRRLTNPQRKSFGLLYDGLQVMHLFRELIPREESSLRGVHIIFTQQLLGTWEEGDQRFHARAAIYGFPSIISLSGLVEAPAKPREYYLLKQQYAALGMPDASLALQAEFRSRCLDHDDERLTEVAKGYLLQAIFNQLLGKPFCEDGHCRLFNAHWQEEMLRAQLEGPYELCPHHQQLLGELRGL